MNSQPTKLSRKVIIGVATALVGAVTASTLLFSGAVNAQTPVPGATAVAPATKQSGGLRERRGPGGRLGHFGSAANSSHAVAAKLLGIDEAALRTAMQGGKTIAALATEKGVDLSTISNAILEAQKADLTQAVTDGKLTQAQADQMLADAPARITDMLSRTMPEKPGGFGGGRGGKGGMGGMGVKGGKGGAPGGKVAQAVVAKALGIDETALRTELLSGKTIADVAKAKGVDLAGVQKAILDAQTAELAQAVTDGRITQAQADQKLADAPARITEMLNRTQPAGRGGRGRRGDNSDR